MNIISLLSNQIVDRLCNSGIIPNEQKPIYVYGFEIVISSIIGLLLVLVLSLVSDHFIDGVFFYVVFVVTRTYTGGYHANSYLKCNVVFSTVYILVLVLSELLASMYSIVMHCMILVIYFAAVLGLAPMENLNKPMSDKEISINRTKCIVLSIIWCSISLLLYELSIRRSLVIALSLFFIAMLMIVEKFRKEEKSDD